MKTKSTNYDDRISLTGVFGEMVLDVNSYYMFYATFTEEFQLKSGPRNP